MSPLACFLKKLRQASGLSQERFGRLIGLAGSHISTIESGLRYAPKQEVLRPLAAALHLSADEQFALAASASISPHKLHIPPNAPASAFRFIALLNKQWEQFSEQDFRLLYEHVKSMHHDY